MREHELMKKIKIFADNLLAHESLHFFSGVIMFFVIFKLFGQVKYSAVAFLISLLIDSDHYLEGLFYNRFKIRWIFSSYPHIFWQKTGKMTLLFHSWEVLPVILILGRVLNQWPLAVAVVLPAVLHYLIDNIIYCSFRKMPILQYFFLFRLYHKFDTKILCPKLSNPINHKYNNKNIFI